MQNRTPNPWDGFKAEREELPKASPAIYALAIVLFAVGGAALGAFLFLAFAGHGFSGTAHYEIMMDKAIAQPLFYGFVAIGVISAEITLVAAWLHGRKSDARSADDDGTK
ncbi:hypothetical protein JXA32_16715 [Candidatus Sumerlaeota bacterium]|nr:hypothetical protein [Candidatus Sumerlaeota bacterium]